MYSENVVGGIGFNFYVLYIFKNNRCSPPPSVKLDVLLMIKCRFLDTATNTNKGIAI